MLNPALLAGGVLVVLLAVGGVARKPLALAMFVFAAFVAGTVLQELWRGVRARRAMSDDSVPVAVLSLVRRNRRRYGGYFVHLGVALLFVGIAASSAFQQARDVRLEPGQSARIGGYDVTYVRPTGEVVAAPNGRLERIDLGAEMRVSRDGAFVEDLVSRRSYFPSQNPTLGSVSRFFEGEATSEVALDAGLRKDLWTVVSPDINDLMPRVKEGDRVFARAAEGGQLSAQDTGALLGEALRGLASSYASDPPPATFRLIVSPLVTWMWIGAIVVFLGGLIALWPGPDAARRQVAARYAARVAEDLGRA
jgi:cytochrome c-type biogenesis protein CcmF